MIVYCVGQYSFFFLSQRSMLSKLVSIKNHLFHVSYIGSEKYYKHKWQIAYK